MFEIFNKDLSKMEEQEIVALNDNARKMVVVNDEIKKLMETSSGWEKKKHGPDKKQAEEALRGNSEETKNLLRQVLELLHNEQKEAKEALKAELQKQLQ